VPRSGFEGKVFYVWFDAPIAADDGIVEQSIGNFFGLWKKNASGRVRALTPVPTVDGRWWPAGLSTRCARPLDALRAGCLASCVR